ncbi:MAG: O-antigen ligase family protein [Oscillospiraceae bacterium]|nr:O-antigen ligase family protein [Oscillospiraceae bacterium]
MGKTSKNPAQPATDIRIRIAGWAAEAFTVVFTIWQGSYFPLQFLLMMVLLIVAFVAFGKTITVTKEAALLFTIPLLFAISLFAKSENVYAGLTETLRALILPMCLILFCNIGPARIKKAVFAALMCVAVLGLLAFASIINIPGGIIEGSNRLQSVIQYANTTALLMLIGILYAVDDYVSGRKIGSLLCCAVFAAALLLTGSRTTLAVAIGACFLYSFIKTGKKGKLITAGVLVAACCALAGFSMLMDVRLLRLSLYEPTLVERWITYGDAVRLMRGNWLFGIGAGNWQEWQFRFQSAPYQVKFIHNHYLQLLLDGGILAPLVFCAAMLPPVFKAIRIKSVHSVILIAILLHAILDFDLIFSAVAMIAAFSLSQISSKGKSFKPGRFRYAAVLPLAAVVALWGSELFTTVADVNLEKGKLDASMGAYKAALALNPFRADLYYRMAQSTRDIGLTTDYIVEAIEHNPRDSGSVSILALIEAKNGNYSAALELCDSLIDNRKYSEEYRSQYRDIAEMAFADGAIGEAARVEIFAKLDEIPLGINPLYIQYIG